MKRHILGAILFLITSSLFSQKPVFFEQKGDTVIFYLSCNGSLTEKDNAIYKRIGLFDNEILSFNGNVIDYYYPEGPIAFRAKYRNGFYEGRIINYYETGAIKEIGNYKSNNRDSTWIFYFKNETVEKKIDYSHPLQKLIEYYKKNGKPVFLDGNGKYKGYSNENYISCEQHQINGELRDGVMVGRWTINLDYSVSTEVFENGRFIRGHETPHNRIYDDASIINPSGFPYYENVTYLNYQFACNKHDLYNYMEVPVELELVINHIENLGGKPGLYIPSYNKEIIENGFLEELEQEIIEKINTNEFFYALLEFQLDNGVINSNSFKSITNNRKKADELKNIIISLNKWDTPDDNVSFTIYLPVFWENGLVYLKPKDIMKFNLPQHTI